MTSDLNETKRTHHSHEGPLRDWKLNGRNSLSKVAERLGLDPRTLRKLMDATPEHIAPAWINVGTSKKASYRWFEDDIDRWLQEVREWQASTGPRQVGRKSDGGTRTGASARRPAQTKTSRRSSSKKSSGAKPSGSGGSLLRLVDKLTSN